MLPLLLLYPRRWIGRAAVLVAVANIYYGERQCFPTEGAVERRAAVSTKRCRALYVPPPAASSLRRLTASVAGFINVLDVSPGAWAAYTAVFGVIVGAAILKEG